VSINPITDEGLVAIVDSHSCRYGVCRFCEQSWPCTTRRMVSNIEAINRTFANYAAQSGVEEKQEIARLGLKIAQLTVSNSLLISWTNKVMKAANRVSPRQMSVPLSVFNEWRNSLDGAGILGEALGAGDLEIEGE